MILNRVEYDIYHISFKNKLEMNELEIGSAKSYRQYD